MKNIREPVGAAGSSVVLPVCNQKFALCQLDLLPCPEDLVVLAIRNISAPISLKLENPRAAYVKVGKMGGRNPVLGQRRAQFLDTDDSPVNNGKRIDRSADCSLIGKI